MTDASKMVEVDAIGLLCPLPVLRARKVLAGMAAGQVLTIATTDPMAVIDLPHFCIEAGHDLLSQAQTGDVTRWVIRAGGAAQGGQAPRPGLRGG